MARYPLFLLVCLFLLSAFSCKVGVKEKGAASTDEPTELALDRLEIEHSLLEDTSATLSLGNYFQANSLRPTCKLESESTHSSAECSCTIEGNCTFDYLPNSNWFGSEEFEYRITRGTQQSPLGKVIVRVTSVNDDPVILNNQHFDVREDQQGKEFTFLVSDPDQELTSSCAIIGLTNPPACSCNSPLTQCNFQWNPPFNTSGSVPFNIGVLIGTNSYSRSAIMDISSVDDAPVLQNSANVTLLEDPLLPSTITFPWTDIDGGSVTGCTVTRLPSLSNASTCSCSTSPSTCTVSYSPRLNLFGSDTLSIQMQTGGIPSNVAIVIITVTAQNDAPVIVNNQHFSLLEDQLGKVFTIAVNDPDQEPTSSCALTGLVNPPACSCNSPLTECTFQWNPPSNANGSFPFTFAINIGANSYMSSAFMDISAVDDLPELSAISTVITLEDTSVVITMPYTDVDGPQPTGYQLTVAPRYGTIAASPAFSCTAVSCSFTYRPNPNVNFQANGNDSFSIRLTSPNLGSPSNAVLVNVRINSVDDLPAPFNAAYLFQENDSPRTIQMLYSEVDGIVNPSCRIVGTPRSQTPLNCTCSLVSPTCSITYQPLPDTYGTVYDSFQWHVTSNGAESLTPGTVNIEVNRNHLFSPTNQAGVDLPSASGKPLAIGNLDLVLGQDLVAAEGNTLVIYFSQTGTPTGLSSSAVTIDPNFPSINEISIIDLDNDGDQDIFAMAPGGVGGGGRTYINQGSRSFIQGFPISGWAFDHHYIGYIDQDLIPDIIFASETVASAMSIYYGHAANGLYSCSPQIGRIVGFGVTAKELHLVSLDSNNSKDLVVLSPQGGAGILTFLDFGTDPATSVGQPSGVAGSFLTLALGHANNDGYLDLVVSSASSPTFNGTTTLRVGLPGGFFGIPGVSGNPGLITDYIIDSSASRSIFFHDFNGDGFQDLLLGRYGTFTDAVQTHTDGIFLSNGLGSFPDVGVPFTNTPTTTERLLIGDINGDGYVDIVEQNASGTGFTNKAYLDR